MEQLVVYNKEQYRSPSGAWPPITSLQLAEQSGNTRLLQIVYACCQIDGMGMRSRSVMFYTWYCMYGACTACTVWSHWSTLLSYNWYGACSHSPNNCIRLPHITETTDILQHMMHVDTQFLCTWYSELCRLPGLLWGLRTPSCSSRRTGCLWTCTPSLHTPCMLCSPWVSHSSTLRSSQNVCVYVRGYTSRLWCTWEQVTY